MKDVKPFLTYEQQIVLLIDRGLIIDDKNFAYRALSSINYYRLINAYGLGFFDKEKGCYRTGTTFFNIYDLYQFDQKLRHVVSELIEIFEVKFRTKLAYCLGKRYGALGYLSEGIYENFNHYKLFLESFNRERKAQSKSPLVAHHDQVYGGQMPIWTAVEILSFGTISKMYCNLNRETRTDIAKELGTTYAYLNSWLRSFVEVRNICAHYGRLYFKPLMSPPKLYRDMRFNNNGIFAVIYILTRFAPNSVSLSLNIRIQGAIAQHKSVELSKIGFPANWRELLGSQ